ncbi:hypothetical protein BO83DRAFT_443276 [Aspergillus eucalypticola CBS 122712]|uniref:Uncharacterized protein n=1 Tax=Aspergillus eucalypticola (strain CBS 122712 / IBT 29274) TaxID=1448314 RepID=A0A317WHG5_ASPEC|nr:uncharacterized protein BO83DRAFT_443276 [Aspergillus eucalypticola CBS 122712]PWY85485.1 hypothetical protein BO83DRAFT_443276 [Aspergillus eucalypticola CBS 122712]
MRDFNFDTEDVFVWLQDMDDNRHSFILDVRIEKPSWSYDSNWTILTPYLFLPPLSNDTPTFEDLKNSVREQHSATKPSIPYYVEITTQMLSQSAIYVIDIVPKLLDREQTSLEIHDSRYWIGLLHEGLNRDLLVESVYRSWLDYLCDRGIHVLRLLALSPWFFTIPIDHLAKLCVSLTMPVVSHIIS